MAEAAEGRRDTAAASASAEVPVVDQGEAAEEEAVAADAPSAWMLVAAVAVVRPSSPGTTRDLRLRVEEERTAHAAREEAVLAVEAVGVPADCSAWVPADRLQPKDQSPSRRDAPWSCTRAAARTASSRR